MNKYLRIIQTGCLIAVLGMSSYTNADNGDVSAQIAQLRAQVEELSTQLGASYKPEGAFTFTEVSKAICDRYINALEEVMVDIEKIKTSEFRVLDETTSKMKTVKTDKRNLLQARFSNLEDKQRVNSINEYLNCLTNRFLSQLSNQSELTNEQLVNIFRARGPIRAIKNMIAPKVKAIQEGKRFKNWLSNSVVFRGKSSIYWKNSSIPEYVCKLEGKAKWRETLLAITEGIDRIEELANLFIQNCPPPIADRLSLNSATLFVTEFDLSRNRLSVGTGTQDGSAAQTRSSLVISGIRTADASATKPSGLRISRVSADGALVNNSTNVLEAAAPASSVVSAPTTAKKAKASKFKIKKNKVRLKKNKTVLASLPQTTASSPIPTPDLDIVISSFKF